MTRPVLIGEANPYGGPAKNALVPMPRGCAGERLQRLVLQLSVMEYMRGYERVNLCGQEWRDSRGADAASVLMVGGELTPPWHREPIEPETPFVLLGAKVARAFGLEFAPFTVAEARRQEIVNADDLAGVPEQLRFATERAKVTAATRRVVVLPHPSGLSRAWNEPGAFERAREALRGAGCL